MKLCKTYFFFRFSEKFYNREITKEPEINKYYPSSNNFSSVQSWLKSVHPSYQEDTDLADFIKLKNNLRQYASAFYLNNTKPMHSTGSITSDLSNSNEELFSPAALNDPYLRYRSCENLNINKQPKINTFRKRFHKSSESLFYNRTKPEYLNNSAKFFLHDLDTKAQNNIDNDLKMNLENKFFTRDLEEKVTKNDQFESDLNQSDAEEIYLHSTKPTDPDRVELAIDESVINLSNGEIIAGDSREKDDQSIIETDSLNSADYVVQESKNIQIHEERDTLVKANEAIVIPIKTDETIEIPRTKDIIPTAVEIVEEEKEENIINTEEEKNHYLFVELKALYLLAKNNLEFVVICNNDASVEVESPIDVLQKNQEVLDLEFLPEPNNVEELADTEEDHKEGSQPLIVEKVNPPLNTRSPEILRSDTTGEPNNSKIHQDSPDKFISDSEIESEISDDEKSLSSNECDFETDTSSKTESSSELKSFSEYEDESLEEEREYEERVFHETLVENIQETIFVDDIENTPEQSNMSTFDHIEKIKIINFNPCMTPTHIIRINVSDDVINATKKNYTSTENQNLIKIMPESFDVDDSNFKINDIQTVEEIPSKTQERVEINQSLKPEIDSATKQKIVLDKNLPAKSTINVENRIIDVENESLDLENKSPLKNPNQVVSKEEMQEISSSPTEKESFSGYIREIIITEDTQSNVILKANEEEKFTHVEQTKEFSHEEYLSDSSDNSFKVLRNFRKNLR